MNIEAPTAQPLTGPALTSNPGRTGSPLPAAPDPEAIRRHLLVFRGPGDVIPLDHLSAPLVGQMQACIRYQHEQLDQAARAIAYVLNRIAREQAIRYLMGAGTQTFENLTQAYAEIREITPAQVQDHYLPGSSKLHKYDGE